MSSLSSDLISMTIRKCKSKYRGVSLDPPEIESPKSRDKVYGSLPPFNIFGSLNRANSIHASPISDPDLPLRILRFLNLLIVYKIRIIFIAQIIQD
ncbi:unnamed protein product [Cochlearia groenlandica]